MLHVASCIVVVIGVLHLPDKSATNPARLAQLAEIGDHAQLRPRYRFSGSCDCSVATCLLRLADLLLTCCMLLFVL